MKELPQRKPNRLKGYDYSQNGAYFVTICAKDRLELFSAITVGAATCRPCSSSICRPNTEITANGRPYVELSDIGYAIDIAINNIPKTYPLVLVDAYVIMPNHVHLILILDNGRHEQTTREERAELIVQFHHQVAVDNGRQVAAPTTVQTIIGHMKRFVSMKYGFSVWQKSFHDHIIRNENDYIRIAEYIENNPANWMEDCFYTPVEAASCPRQPPAARTHRKPFGILISYINGL